MDRVAALLERARNETQLQDFGADSFREGLERVVAAADSEARLSDKGRVGFDAMVVGRLTNRLKVEDWYARHPEIEDEQIDKPLVGLGLPRTGSTAMFHLVAADPHIRFIRMWESLSPTPPPDIATEAGDPRFVAARKSMAQHDREQPRKKTMLPMSVDSPMECGLFMSHEFKSQFFHSMMHVPSYTQWVMHEADITSAYVYLKRVLKLLQWRRPPKNKWRLKSPPHTGFITALDKVFPDAKFWMTHRDVAKVIPSVCDLFLEQHNVYSDHVDKVGIGRLNMEIWTLAMRRMIEFRDAGAEHRFFDVHFAPFQKDPFPAMEKLYAFLGEELTPEALAAMKKWREETPREKHGAHTYDAADFGIDIPDLRKRFAFYTERFGVTEQ